MKCPRCGSDNVAVQAVQQTKLVDAHHGFLWWSCVGWWWVAFKWLVLTMPALIVWLFHPKRQRVKQRTVSTAVRQDCGHSWTVG